jgi:hypothetical protein
MAIVISSPLNDVARPYSLDRRVKHWLSGVADVQQWGQLPVFQPRENRATFLQQLDRRPRSAVGNKIDPFQTRPDMFVYFLAHPDEKLLDLLLSTPAKPLR